MEKNLCDEFTQFVGVKGLEEVRLVKRYDVQGVSFAIFSQAVRTVLCEVVVDDWYPEMPDPQDAVLFAVESLPGQFDQRSDSAASCIQLMSQGERPLVRSALLYYLYGDLSEDDVIKAKTYVINPVDSREADLEKPESLTQKRNVVRQEPILDGFVGNDDLAGLKRRYALAMDVDDLSTVQSYFHDEGRNPSLTELRVIDTYWSDHCRHTTFGTHLDEVTIDDPEVKRAWDEYLACRKELGRTKPVTLMDIATIGAKVLKKRGVLTTVDESPEINACTVRITVGGTPWLLLFKNETHNHPTEIEPFGGAATCLGGAIRDPLSGRAYVYQAMRLTGCADPRMPVERTLAGRLPQKKIAVCSAQGYSSYGNQIGLATGLVDELYHERYRAKHMELGAVIAAVPADHVVRREPLPGDVVVLVGGRTGRDGCGGATGSSKSHDGSSLETCGAEVQKGNAPEERKLQRLFRNVEASRMIKRCNDFGAGGVSVAIGELAEGLDIDLDKIPVKYQGLCGTELSISESQERMAVVLDAADAARFIRLADEENLEATVVAQVTDTGRLVMRFQGTSVVDVKRSFLDSNGAVKHASMQIPRMGTKTESRIKNGDQAVLSLLSDLNVCSKQGLSERFDSTVGAGTVLMPFGGRKQKSPSQVMCALLPSDDCDGACSVMAYGCDPMLLEKNPFEGGYRAVVHSIAKLAACGCDVKGAWLSLQEFFGKPVDPGKWGIVCSALLGALRAQLQFGVGAIGGKDSMSGTFGKLDVPPTLVSFAVAAHTVGKVIPDHFQKSGDFLYLCDDDDLPSLYDRIHAMMGRGLVRSAYAVGYGGIVEALCKMAFGNEIGVDVCSGKDLFRKRYGAIILETEEEIEGFSLIGRTQRAFFLSGMGFALDLRKGLAAWEGTLEGVYPRLAAEEGEAKTLSLCEKPAVSHAPGSYARPSVLIPVFPGTNCEFDLSKALADSNFIPRVMVVRNRDKEAVTESVRSFSKALRECQVLFIPGGFSGGDEPDGSGKFIAAFLRNPEIAMEVTRLLDDRKGLIGGICNGFQALIKLGLLPYGKICDLSADSPTLTFNTIGRHQSMLVRTRVCSVLSPWLSRKRIGDVDMLPVSHGEGRFVASEDVLARLRAAGQIATQYVDENGSATMKCSDNPNGSAWAIEGITSADGRVFGRMAHSERCGHFLYRNTPYTPDFSLFAGAYDYFR